MISVVPIGSKNQNLYLLYTLNDFDVICSFFNLTDLSSLADLGGRNELQCMISSKISEIYLFGIKMTCFGPIVGNEASKKSHVLENFENISIGGCGGYPLHSKSILKVVNQMVEFCEYATALFLYLLWYIK